MGAPVPAFLPRELVETARAHVSAVRAQERRNPARGWELRGLLRCPSCGGAMTTHTTKRDDKLYHYYRCHRSVDYGATCKQRMERADKAEAAKWASVSNILKDPERILVGMDALIERKRAELRGDPDREAASWLREARRDRPGAPRATSSHCDRAHERGGARQALADLEETRRTAERELEAIGRASGGNRGAGARP